MFLPMLAGNCRGVQEHPRHLQEVHFVVGQRERKVERGIQVDVSAHVGSELQRQYKDRFITYRRYTLL
jgi:hypothetical protein